MEQVLLSRVRWRRRRGKRFSPLEAGFTLVEMIVAMVLLAAGITAALGGVSSVIETQRLSEEYTKAALLAQSILTEVEQVDGLIEGTDQGDFGEQYPGWRWEREVVEAESEGLLQVTVVVYWTSGRRERSFSLVTYRLAPSTEETTGTEGTTGAEGGS